MQMNTIVDHNTDTMPIPEPTTNIEHILNTSSFGKSQPKQGKHKKESLAPLRDTDSDLSHQLNQILNSQQLDR